MKVYVVSCITKSGSTIVNIFSTLELAKEYCVFLINGNRNKILSDGKLYILLDEGTAYDIQAYTIIGNFNRII